MKTVDIRPLIKAVRNIELQQARNALKSKGEVPFDKNNPPPVEYHNGQSPATGDAMSITYDSSRKTAVVKIWDNLTGTPGDFTADNLFPGELTRLLERL